MIEDLFDPDYPSPDKVLRLSCDSFQCHFPVIWDKADPPTIGYFAHFFSIKIDDEVGEARVCIDFFNDELAMFKIWPEKNPINKYKFGGMFDIAYAFRRRAIWTRRFEPQEQIVGKRYSKIPRTIKCPHCEKGRLTLETSICSKCGLVR